MLGRITSDTEASLAYKVEGDKKYLDAAKKYLEAAVSYDIWGYAGLPMTEQHNTILFDGAGQAREGKGHDVFADVSHDRLDQIRITEVKLEPHFAYVRGEAAPAYEENLGARRFTRNFLFTALLKVEGETPNN